MCDRPNASSAEGDKQQPAIPQRTKKALLAPACWRLERYNVRLDIPRVNDEAGNAGEPLRKESRVGVVLGQPFDHRLESHQSGRSYDACLTHPPAEHFAIPSGTQHEIRGTGHNGAQGSP